MSILPDFDIVNDVLQRCANIDTSASTCENGAAEAHGQLCAMLATLPAIDMNEWFKLYSAGAEQDEALADETRSILQEVFQATETGFASPDMDFQLLLPDDEEDINVRLQAISHWCQGFLLGLGSAGVANVEKLPGNIPEIIRDFVEISRADTLARKDTQEDEAAYMEIMEFVRMGTLLFKIELQHFLNIQVQPEPAQTH